MLFSRFEKSIARLFDEQAQDTDEDEEEDERPVPGGEVIVPEDERQAIEAVQRRHQKNRQFLDEDATAIAEQYRRKAMEERTHRFTNIYDTPGVMQAGRIGTVLQQSLLPSVSDPCIWRYKVATGKEEQLVQTIMRKAIDSRMKGGPLRIKSAFCGSSKGYIYVEGVAEPLAREAVFGLRGIFQSSMKLVPVQEMTSLLNVVTNKQPLQMNQWARVSRGPLKGDLARIVMLYEGGDKVMVQVVPRPDYSAGVTGAANANAAKKVSAAAGSKARPPQRLFEVSEVIKAGGESFRKPHPDDRGSHYEFWNNEYYKDGFLYKVVNPDTFLHTVNVKPRVEEQKLFLTAKSKQNKDRDDFGDDDDMEEDDDENDLQKSQSLLTDLAQDMSSAREDAGTGKLKAAPFVVGDLVRVTGGELRNLVARVVAVNDIQKSVRVVPVSRSGLTGEFTIETALLMKHVDANEHVKVITGPHMGQTGRVVNVNIQEGRAVAAILTDGINSEIVVDVSNLQVSNEVTTGLGSLMGYELYDLVALSDNECAVVIFVGSEKLTVKNHLDLVKDVYPQELQGKRNSQSTRSTGFDKHQNNIAVGNVVNVLDGAYAKKSGTIKHIMKGTLWLHSDSILKHSGIFAVRARSCVVAGVKKAPGLGAIPALGGAAATSAYGASMSAGLNTAASSVGIKMSNFAKPNPKAGRDASVGLTVRITKGQYKGLLAQVVDASGEQYTVELLAKLKKITVDKANTAMVGDKGGSLDPKKRVVAGGLNEILPDTKYLQGETPSHISMGDTPSRSFGAATPSSTPSSYYGNSSYYGEATPMGMQTPGGNVWSVSDKDLASNATGSAAYGNVYGDNKNQQQGYNWNVESGSNQYSYGSGARNNAPNSSYSYNSSNNDTWGSPASSQGSYRSGSNPPGAGASPTSSVSYSPYGQPPSPIGAIPPQSNSAGSGSGSGLPVSDWVSEMIVTFRYGPHVGKTAVVTRPPDDVS
jgi:transcription elongation factor SPT5